MTAPMYEPGQGPRPIAPVSWYGGGEGQTRRPGAVVLGIASLLLVILAVAQGYVSWRAQFAFIDAAKHAPLPSALEALGLDAGAVIFALLALAHARMGRPARIERTLNLACAFGSMTMNLLGADLASPRSVAVYVLPAVLYAACSDRLIATAGHLAGVQETSVWRFAGTGARYGLRAMVALPSTVTGGRRALLAATPLPGAEDADGAGSAIPEGIPPAAPRAALTAIPPPTRRRTARTRTSGKPDEAYLAEAQEAFADELAAGTVPGVKRIQAVIGGSQERAGRIQDLLRQAVTP
jgi:hypothetical protein